MTATTYEIRGTPWAPEWTPIPEHAAALVLDTMRTRPELAEGVVVRATEKVQDAVSH